MDRIKVIDMEEIATDIAASPHGHTQTVVEHRFQYARDKLFNVPLRSEDLDHFIMLDSE